MQQLSLGLRFLPAASPPLVEILQQRIALLQSSTDQQPLEAEIRRHLEPTQTRQGNWEVPLFQCALRLESATPKAPLLGQTWCELLERSYISPYRRAALFHLAKHFWENPDVKALVTDHCHDSNPLIAEDARLYIHSRPLLFPDEVVHSSVVATTPKDPK